MVSIDPSTGETRAEFAAHDAGELSRRIDRARLAFERWGSLSITARSETLRSVARRMRERRDALAAGITSEMGKPITQAEAEVEKCAWACEHFADHAASYLADDPVATDAARSFTRCEPLGVVLAIMPWNFPLWQLFRCAAPALMAGNTIVLKHASNVPGCALAIEALFEPEEPKGLVTTLLAPSGAVAPLIEDPRIAAISLTGSEAAGREVAATAGRALKKCVLELGGSDPFIVLDDVDPVATAARAAAARVQNSGQSCIAAKRFIVLDRVASSFERALVERMRSLRVGDPRDHATEVGPLARADLLDSLHAQVARSLEQGARLALGGAPLERRGWYYAPTVLTDARPGMTAFDEETFGPVAAVIRARDEGEAIGLANQSRFGLGASLWTSDPARGERLAARIEAGAVFVNGMVRSDPRIPFGGIKSSGWGRELGREGAREFVNLKTVWIEKT
jgi:succinate-semialdehyde dehydrogenase/glutarate-semialdehyde dehydrogenase